MMQRLSNAAVRKGHLSDVEPSKCSDSKENNPAYECEEVDHENEQIDAKEDVVIRQLVKAARKRNKPSLQSKGESAALVLVKATNLGKELQIVQEEWALKSEEGANEKRMYQKAFITRMSTRSFTSLVAQLNKARAEAVRSMRFASFLKDDLKHILENFSKWLVESFDPVSYTHLTLPTKRIV